MPSLATPDERRRRHARASRGFTLAEVMAVLAVVSVLAAVATPGFVGMMRDRRTAQDTAMFTDALRVARARALSRGAAVRATIVTSLGGNPTPFIRIDEHVTVATNNPASRPVSGCNAAGEWRNVELYQGRPGTTTLAGFPHTAPGTPQTTIVVCYTPRGRTMVDYPDTTGGGAFVDLRGVVRLATTRGSEEGTTDNIERSVFILPNGLTRMQL